MSVVMNNAWERITWTHQTAMERRSAAMSRGTALNFTTNAFLELSWKTRDRFARETLNTAASAAWREVRPITVATVLNAGRAKTRTCPWEW